MKLVQIFGRVLKFVLRPKWIKFRPISKSGPQPPELGVQIWGVVFAMPRTEIGQGAFRLAEFYENNEDSDCIGIGCKV